MCRKEGSKTPDHPKDRKLVIRSVDVIGMVGTGGIDCAAAGLTPQAFNDWLLPFAQVRDPDFERFVSDSFLSSWPCIDEEWTKKKSAPSRAA